MACQMALASDNIVLLVVTQLALHGEFISAFEAAREIGRFGAVCRAWRESVRNEAVWRALLVRTSPAAICARAGPLPAPVFSATAVGDERDYGDFSSLKESLTSKIERSRYFEEAIVSPFREDGALLRNATSSASSSSSSLFRRRTLVAAFANRSYRAVGMTTFDTMSSTGMMMPLFACTRAADADAEEDDDFELADLSFVFECFELDSSRRRRQRDGSEFREDDGAPENDFVIEKLRHGFAGPPHFAHRNDLGTKRRLTSRFLRLLTEIEEEERLWSEREEEEEMEHLVWATTVRASADGIVQALVPLDDKGNLQCKYTVLVDAGTTSRIPRLLH
jgi:hypothetical protein